jgi:hypothetical protein
MDGKTFAIQRLGYQEIISAAPASWRKIKQ